MGRHTQEPLADRFLFALPLLIVLVILLIVLALATPAYGAEHPAPAPNPLLCIPVGADDDGDGDLERGGSGIPIGPTRVATVQHIMQQGFQLFSSYYYPPKSPGRIEAAGQLATQLSYSTTDQVAIVLSIEAQFPAWLETAPAVTGTAFILLAETVHKVEIFDLKAQLFSDWAPYPGTSGSGVVQWRDGAWRVVGLVRSRWCHACKECVEKWRGGQFDCHCPAIGAYSRFE